MRLILIRHGMTDYNLKKKYCGFTDVDLNKIGRLQTKKIRKKLKGLKIDKIFCSDLKRSYQTAKIIFGTDNHKIIRNSNLREINFGAWEGLNYRQVFKKYPLTYKKWLEYPFSVKIPKAEKAGLFIKRIKKILEKIIRDNYEKTVAIVGHFGPIRIILNTALSSGSKDFWKMKLKPQAIYIIEYKDNLKPQVFQI